MPVDIRQIEGVLDEDVKNSAFIKSLDQRYGAAAGNNINFVTNPGIAYSDTPGVALINNSLNEKEYYVNLTLPLGLKNITDVIDSLSSDLTRTSERIVNLWSEISSLRSEMTSVKPSDITLSNAGIDTTDNANAGINVTGQNGAYYLKLALPKSLTDNFGKTISFTKGNISYSDSAAQGTEVIAAGGGAYQVNVTLPNNVTVVSAGGGDSTVALAKGTVSTVYDYTSAGVTPNLRNGIYYLDLAIPVQSGGGGGSGNNSVTLAQGNVDYGYNVGINPVLSNGVYYLNLTLPEQTANTGGLVGSYVKDIEIHLDRFVQEPAFNLDKNDGFYLLELSIPSYDINSTIPVNTPSLNAVAVNADVLCWKELSSDAELANTEDGLSLVKFPASGINYYGIWMKKGTVGGGYFINDNSKLVAGHATRDGGWQKASQILDEHTYQDIIFGKPQDTASGITLNTLTGYNSSVTKVNNLNPGKTIALSGRYGNTNFTGGLLKIGPGIGVGAIEYNGHAIPIVSHGSHVEIPAPFETVMHMSGNTANTTDTNLKMAIQKQGEAIQKLGEAIHYSNAALRQISNTYPALGISGHVSNAESRLSTATTLFQQAINYFAKVK